MLVVLYGQYFIRNVGLYFNFLQLLSETFPIPK